MNRSVLLEAIPRMRRAPVAPAAHPGRTRAVRIALTQSILRWRDELHAAERHLADAVEARSALDIELYTDAVEELRAGINHLGDALAALEGL